MKLYRIPAAPLGVRWQRTQDEAKAIKREHGGTFEPVEVPTDQRGLVAFINELEAEMGAAPSHRRPEPEAGAKPKRDMSASAILDRMDRAHAETALKAALTSIKHGLAMIQRASAPPSEDEPQLPAAPGYGYTVTEAADANHPKPTH